MDVTLKPLHEQVIVITGASSGIGLVTARMAARHGAKVVAVARNEEALRELVDEIKGQGGEATYVVCDVGREEEVQQVAEKAVRAFGRFDTWVNNAGISIFGQVWDVPLDDWHRMFDTTYWGVVYGSLAAVRHYRQRGGTGAIINIGSFFGDRAPAVQGTYASAKFAVHGFTDVLRMELEHNQLPVSVSLIHPGRIDTPYNEHAGNYMPMQPVHRGMVYPPEAVADAILWCAAHPKRDMFVGSQAKFAAVLGAVAPRLTDKIMERLMYSSHQSRERVSSGKRSRALFEPGYGGHERGTHEPHLLRQGNSVYVQATKRPLLTAAVLGATGFVLWSVLREQTERPTMHTTQQYAPALDGGEADIGVTDLEVVVVAVDAGVDAGATDLGVNGRTATDNGVLEGGMDVGATDLGDDVYRTAGNRDSGLAQQPRRGLMGGIDPRLTDLGDDIEREA